MNRDERMLMRMRTGWLIGTVAAAALALPAIASAQTTLGSTTQPAGSAAQLCDDEPLVFDQFADDPNTPYFVPAGGGLITSWSTNTTGDTAGAELEFVVLRPFSGGATVVGVDTETLPTPLPSNNIATFPLTTPITVQAGDTVGIYGGDDTSTNLTCWWKGGTIPTAAVVGVYGPPELPVTAGEPQEFGGTAGPATAMNLAYTLAPLSEDVSVTTSAGPSNAAAGFPAFLSSTVHNGGPFSGAVSFTDTVPAGLKIDSATTTGGGTCTVAAQVVTCSFSDLPSGQSAPVNIIVTPAASGSYVNHVTVAPQAGITDPNTANNTASATLKVAKAAKAQCVVLKLKGTPAGTAKQLLKKLGCKVGKVSTVKSTLAKGVVVKTTPGHGTFAHGKKVGVDVSAGPVHPVPTPTFTG